jgi:23S rRNA pseudouridine1911/1915/1917 synthase
MEFTINLAASLQKMTIETLLTEEWLVPRKQRHFLRSKQHLLVNGQVATFSDRVAGGDEITVSFDDSDFPAKSLDFGEQQLGKSLILYEDAHLVIANKPELMKTHGNAPHEIALQNHIAAACGAPVYVVHRLDFETSGAVLFAKNPFVLPLLDAMLRQRQIHRTYQALCAGHFDQKDLIIRQAIGRNRHDQKRQAVVAHGGKPAVTKVSLLQQFPTCALVHCQLETGRTHQIRVHLSHNGHALIGDPLYHGRQAPRLMLHAKQLELSHPFTKEKIHVTADSDSFEQGLKSLGASDKVARS